MPAINVTHSKATPLPSRTFAAKDLKTHNALVIPSTSLTSSIASSSTIPTSAPVPSPVDSRSASTWSTPMIFGVILAILAVIVGSPSALLAVKKLRSRRRANTSNNAQDTSNTRDTSSGGGNASSNTTECIQTASIDPDSSPSSESSIDPAQPLGNTLDEHRDSDMPHTQLPSTRDDGYEMSNMSGLQSSTSSSRGLVTG